MASEYASDGRNGDLSYDSKTKKAYIELSCRKGNKSITAFGIQEQRLWAKFNYGPDVTCISYGRIRIEGEALFNLTMNYGRQAYEGTTPSNSADCSLRIQELYVGLKDKGISGMDDTAKKLLAPIATTVIASAVTKTTEQPLYSNELILEALAVVKEKEAKEVKFLVANYTKAELQSMLSSDSDN